MFFPLFAEQENDEKGIVPDDMTDTEVDSISNTESDILEVEGRYWSADEEPYLGLMTRIRTKMKTLPKANELRKECFSTEKDVNVDTSTFHFETSASLIKVTVANTDKLFAGSLLTARKWLQ